MSQASPGLIPTTGPATGSAVFTAVKNAISAALSAHEGTTAPTYAVTGTIWADSSVAGTLAYKAYDGTDWNTLVTVNTTTGAVAWAGISTFMHTVLDDTTAAAAHTTLETRKVDGVAKAWIDWNGTGTAAISDSFNVASLTDTGVGTFTINYTAAFGSANYAVHGTGFATYIQCIGANSKAAGSTGVVASSTSAGSMLSATYADGTEMHVVVHGDLA